MQCMVWPVNGGMPCPSCVQAQMLINVLRQGMHPDCVDAVRNSPLIAPPYQPAAQQLQVLLTVFDKKLA